MTKLGLVLHRIQLEELVLSVSEKTLITLGATYSRLTTLRLLQHKHTRDGTADEALRELVLQCPVLERLSLRNFVFRDLKLESASLQCLRFQRSTITDASLMQITRECPNLRLIELIGIDTITCPWLVGATLAQIVVKDCPSLSPMFLTSICSNLPNLIYVSIKSCRNIPSSFQRDTLSFRLNVED